MIRLTLLLTSTLLATACNANTKEVVETGVVKEVTCINIMPHWVGWSRMSRPTADEIKYDRVCNTTLVDSKGRELTLKDFNSIKGEHVDLVCWVDKGKRLIECTWRLRNV